MRPFRFHRKTGDLTLAGSSVAWLGVALIALLVWLSADPSAHERFHPDAAGGDEHHCVVTEFAAGEAYYLSPVIVVRPAETIAEVIQVRAIEAPRESADYVLLPSCGPPAGRV